MSTITPRNMSSTLDHIIIFQAHQRLRFIIYKPPPGLGVGYDIADFLIKVNLVESDFHPG